MGCSQHKAIQSKFLYLQISSLFCVCVCVCVCVSTVHLKRGIRTVRAKNVKKIFLKNAKSLSIDGSLSDQLDRQHGNPLKPDRTRDDVSKNLANWIVA